MKWDFNRRVGRFGILEIKLLQGAAIFLTLAIVKFVPEILNVNVWWFLALVVVCAIRPVYVFLGLHQR